MTTRRFQLPQFSISAGSRSLKPAPQALGVQTAFGDRADFSCLLGNDGQGVRLDNVFHSATIVIVIVIVNNEAGGEAAAATGAVIMPKSSGRRPTVCAVDCPFIFAVLHQASGAPLFVGKVADPTAI